MSLGAVWRMEWRRLWVRPFAWTLLAATLAWSGWQFVLLVGQYLAMQVRLAAMTDAPGVTGLVTVSLLKVFTQLAMVVIPLMTMSLLAGERRAGTLPVLLATGLPTWRIVLGKYLAVLAWLLVWLGLTLLMPLALAPAATPDWGQLAAAALGTALALATLAALGVACSAYASHPALAAVAAVLLTVALWEANLGAALHGVLGGVANWLAMPTHLQPLWSGLVSSADLAWFLIVTLLALALAVRRIGAERERD